MVSSIDDKKISFTNKVSIPYDIVIWCGGIKKSHLTETILSLLNIQHNKGIPTDGRMKVTNTKNVYALGDCAYSGLPPTAQVASQQGEYLARTFNQVELGNTKSFIFQYLYKGQIGYVGKKQSIYQNGGFKISGNLTYYMNQYIHFYNAINWKQRWEMIK